MTTLTEKKDVLVAKLRQLREKLLFAANAASCESAHCEALARNRLAVAAITKDVFQQNMFVLTTVKVANSILDLIDLIEEIVRQAPPGTLAAPKPPWAAMPHQLQQRQQAQGETQRPPMTFNSFARLPPELRTMI